MNDGQRMQKKKLVTVCCKDHTDFSMCYPRFTFSGISQTDKSERHLTIPSYPENLMYYEHFEKFNFPFPNRLSFMFVGGKNEDWISKDFKEYKHVTACDFNQHIASTLSIIQIVKQLPSCKDVRIVLDEMPNLSSSKEEAFPKKLLDEVIVCDSVKSFRLEDAVYTQSKAKVWTSPTRLAEIFAHVCYCFPKLQSIRMEIADVGQNSVMLRELLKTKGLLLQHKITMANGIVSCEPMHLSKPRIMRNPASLSSSVEETVSVKKQEDESSKLTGDLKTTSLPVSVSTPQMFGSPFLQALEHVSETKAEVENGKCSTIIEEERVLASERKTESIPSSEEKNMTEVEVASSSDDEVKVVEVPSKDVELIDISDTEDEFEVVAAKKIKVEQNVPEIVSPVQTDVQRNSCKSSSGPTHPGTYRGDPTGALKSIKVSYSDWENSSDEGSNAKEEDLSRSLASEISFDQTAVKRALIALKDIEDHSVSSNEDMDFREGIHFERRRKKKSQPLTGINKG